MSGVRKRVPRVWVVRESHSALHVHTRRSVHFQLLEISFRTVPSSCWLQSQAIGKFKFLFIFVILCLAIINLFWCYQIRQVLEHITYDASSQNITVSHKSKVVLDCVSTTNEGSYWINETGVMSNEVMMPLNGSLIIPSASQSDNGCYICELRGVSGIVSTRACITVLIPPFFYVSNDVEHSVSMLFLCEFPDMYCVTSNPAFLTNGIW